MDLTACQILNRAKRVYHLDKMRPSEQNNDLSYNIDVQETLEMVKIFASVDRQIFTPWPNCEQFTFETMTQNIDKLSNIFAEAIKCKKTIVLGGCGTSGRLGFFCARKFNRVLENFGLAENINSSGHRNEL